MAGRPEAEIDLQKVDEMLMAGCEGTGIAAYFGIHPSTLYRRIEEQYNMNFAHYRQQKIADGNDLIKLAQFNKALNSVDANGNKGDNTMLIWLGKNRLDQKDKAHNEVSTPQGEKLIIEIYDAGKKAEGDGGVPSP